MNGTTVDKTEGLGKIRQRFEFLKGQNSLIELAVFLSRESDSGQMSRVSSALGLPVARFCTLSPDGGSLNVEGVLSALCEIMLLSNVDHDGADAIAAEHLLKLLQDVRACNSDNQLWTTAKELYWHVSAHEEHCGGHDRALVNSAPLSHVLGRFDGAVQFLAERHLVVRRHGLYSSHFGLWHQDETGKSLYFCEQPCSDRDVAVRLPVTDRMLASVLKDQQFDGSAKFWGNVRIDDETVETLEEAISKEISVSVALVLLDDWQLARHLSSEFPKPLCKELMKAIQWKSEPLEDCKWIKIQFK